MKIVSNAHALLAVLVLFLPPFLAAQMTHQEFEAAAVAFSQNDPRSVSELSNALFAYPHNFEIPGFVVSLLKPKLESAQVEYLQGRNVGVSEGDLVDATNDLSDSLSLPLHAKTTLSQVHEIRMKALYTFPRFMGTNIGTKDSFGKFHMSNRMSPFQAAHLMLCITDLKFTLPEYQLTPAEWEKAHSASIQNDAIPNAASAVRHRLILNNNARTKELYDSLQEALTNLSDANGISLALKTLNHLGAR